MACFIFWHKNVAFKEGKKVGQSNCIMTKLLNRTFFALLFFLNGTLGHTFVLPSATILKLVQKKVFCIFLPWNSIFFSILGNYLLSKSAIDIHKFIESTCQKVLSIFLSWISFSLKTNTLFLFTLWTSFSSKFLFILVTFLQRCVYIILLFILAIFVNKKYFVLTV